MSELLSKEAIIKKYEPYPNKAEVNIIGVMMEEYAKQEAIGFARFVQLNFLSQLGSFEDAYEKYQQSKTKQP